MGRAYVTGIEQHGRRFRFRVVGLSDPGIKSCASYEEAERERRRYQRELAIVLASEVNQGRTIASALDEYEKWKRDPNGKGNKKGTVATAITRLKNFFPESRRRLPLHRVTPELCERLYTEVQVGASVDTHRGTLSAAKTFLDWCAEKRWIKGNPCSHVKGTGKRSRGKPQLTVDEVRRFTDVALWLCEYGAEALNVDKATGKHQGGRPVRYSIGGPAAALATFYLGLRAGEVADLKVRMLDDGGRSIIIDDAKTKAGERRQEVPAFLRDYFKALKKGKLPTAPLFGGRRWWVLDWVKRICDLAGAPLVCAHAMRGLHVTLAIQAGQTAEAVTRAVGHEYAGFRSVTLRHYAQAGSHEQAVADKALQVVRSGPKAS